MKIRPLALVALIASSFVFVTASASAQQPIPGIKQTAAYRQLNTYVNILRAKRSTPTTAARRKVFKTNLTSRRSSANAKVQSLYSLKLTRLSKQDDKQQRRDIKKIRQNQRAQVQSLNASLASRLNALKVKQNAASDRITAAYNVKLNPLADRRDSLRRQLDKTTNPVRRSQLTRQINRIQVQLNALVNDRTTDLNNLANSYNLKAQSVNNLFAARINGVKAQAQQQIQQEQNAWRQTYAAQFQAAKTRRDAQKDMVGALAERGFGYIEQMPPLG